MKFKRFFAICILTITTQIMVNAQLTVTPISSNYNGYGVSYFGANDGSTNLTVTGGAMPYSYEWSNGAITKNVDNLAAGFYEVIVTDASGEVVEERVTLEAPEELEVYVNPHEGVFL